MSIQLKDFGEKIRAAGCRDEVQVLIHAAGDSLAGVVLRYVLIKLHGRASVAISSTQFELGVGLSYKVLRRVRLEARKAGLTWVKCRQRDGAVTCEYSIDAAMFWAALDAAIKKVASAPVLVEEPEAASQAAVSDTAQTDISETSQTAVSETAQTAIPILPKRQSPYSPTGSFLSIDSNKESQEKILNLPPQETTRADALDEEEEPIGIFKRYEQMFAGHLDHHLAGLRKVSAGMADADVEAFLKDMVRSGARSWAYVQRGLELERERIKVAPHVRHESAAAAPRKSAVSGEYAAFFRGGGS